MAKKEGRMSHGQYGMVTNLAKARAAQEILLSVVSGTDYGVEDDVAYAVQEAVEALVQGLIRQVKKCTVRGAL